MGSDKTDCPSKNEKLVNVRTELDAKRCQAVLAYLSAQPNGTSGRYEVQAHDASDPAIHANGQANAFRALANVYSASAQGAGGSGNVTGAGGGTAPGTPAAGGQGGQGGTR